MRINFLQKNKKTAIQAKLNTEESVQTLKEVQPACFTEEQAAIYINMSRGFLRAARMNGHLKNHASAPPFIKNGRTIRYLKSDLDAWLQSLRVIQTTVDGY